MTIAVYVPFLAERSVGNFIVETFFSLFQVQPSHKLILITDDSFDLPGKFINTEVVVIKPPSRNLLLKKFWIDRILMDVVKKNNADLFISAGDFCSLKASLPQLLLIPDPEKIKPAYIKKAKRLIVLNESEKQKIIDKFEIDGSKVIISYPAANKIYSPISTDIKELIKRKYSDSKEFFLYRGNLKQAEDLINLLKSFSQFKKRQQSSFKLLLLIDSPDPLIEKSIESYKYRSDVILIRSTNIEEKAQITATAYTLVLPFNTIEDITTALKAMQSGVPVITTKDSSINEVAGNAVLYSENEIRDTGEKMMQLYKDENLRNTLIEKGKEVSKNFTQEKSSDHLWQCIMEALN
jgi:glycosyltransferase involved in cell wall biosynthesis